MFKGGGLSNVIIWICQIPKFNAQLQQCLWIKTFLP
jgi:hypothetical protein